MQQWATAVPASPESCTSACTPMVVCICSPCTPTLRWEAEAGGFSEARWLASLVYTVANKIDPVSNNVGGEDSDCRLASGSSTLAHTLTHTNRHIEYSCTYKQIHNIKKLQASTEDLFRQILFQTLSTNAKCFCSDNRYCNGLLGCLLRQTSFFLLYRWLAGLGSERTWLSFGRGSFPAQSKKLKMENWIGA